jgi:hypothetical protein
MRADLGNDHFPPLSPSDPKNCLGPSIDADETFKAYPQPVDSKVNNINAPNAVGDAWHWEKEKGNTINSAKFIKEFGRNADADGVVEETHGLRGLRRVIDHELAHATEGIGALPRLATLRSDLLRHMHMNRRTLDMAL